MNPYYVKRLCIMLQNGTFQILFVRQNIITSYDYEFTKKYNKLLYFGYREKFYLKYTCFVRKKTVRHQQICNFQNEILPEKHNIFDSCALYQIFLIELYANKG